MSTLLLLSGMRPKHRTSGVLRLQCACRKHCVTRLNGIRRLRGICRFPLIPLLLSVFSLLLLIASCSLFETRDPEDPGTTTVPVFIQPDRPQDVIQNLQNAVRALNVDNYRRCLTESFVYEPSSVAQSSNPDIWQGWGFTEEEVYFNNMRAEAEGLSGHELQLENRRFVQISQDEEQFDADYRIKVQHNRQGLPVEAEGRIRLFISRDEFGNWAIASWSDAAEGSEFTWSDFRAAFL